MYKELVPGDNTVVGMWRRVELRLQQPAHAGSSLADFSTLKMEAIRSSETSVHARSTQPYIPEDGILHSHRRENVKPYNAVVTTFKLLRSAILLASHLPCTIPNSS
jgi:hypothetical protein